MFIKILVAATVTLGSSVQAQEATPDTWMAARSSLSRASVVADLLNARLSGLFDAISAPVWSFEPLRRGIVTASLVNGIDESVRPIVLSRADVRADVMRAHESGELARGNAEVHDFLGARDATALEGVPRSDGAGSGAPRAEQQGSVAA
jgi:hypothetical protein